MSTPYSAIVEAKLYVGGGLTVAEYHPQEDKWLNLEQYQYQWFAMVALNNKLTLVGSMDPSTRQVTNQIAVWEMKGVSYQWTHPYPNMPTNRYSPAVATYKWYLVVAGGHDAGFSELTAVEILNADSWQWMSMTPLPVKCYHMTTAIIQHELFLIGGSLTMQTLVVSLPDIVQTGANSNPTKTSTHWRTLPPPPLEWFSAIALRGFLLAIGGRHRNDRSTAIHVYQPDTKSWSKVGDLPTALSACSCSLLPSGEILVAGGWDSNGKGTNRVDVSAL